MAVCRRCNDSMVISLGPYTGNPGLERLICCPVCVAAKRTIGVSAEVGSATRRDIPVRKEIT